MGIASIQDLQSYYAKVNETDEKQKSCDYAKVNEADEKKNLHCALKLLFDAERKHNCHIFTSNKAICSRDFFYKNTHVVNRVTILETVLTIVSLIDCRSGITADFYSVQVQLDSPIEVCVHVHKKTRKTNSFIAFESSYLLVNTCHIY